MKTTKKIFAALLAVMMLLVMVPFSASAAEVPTEVTFNLDCTEKGYVFTVYQLATLNTTNGEYKYDIKSNVNADVAAAINTPTDGDNFSSAKIVELLKDDAVDNLGVALDTFNSTGATPEAPATKSYTVASGIYYIKATEFPAGIKSSQSSLVVLPYYTTEGWETTLPTDSVNGKVTENTIHLAMKNSATTATSDKNILVDTPNKNTPVKNATTGYNETVTYQLKASVMGSVENKLQSFIITDTMDEGLTFKKITSVYLTSDAGNKTLTADTEYTVLGNNADGTNITVGEGDVETECTFAVSLNTNVLNTDVFYSYSNVIVEFEAEVNANADVKVAIPNNSNLLYKNKDGQWDDTDKQTVNVYTAGLKLYKTNAKNEPLAGATFGVYTDAACETTPIATATSGDDGYATFMRGENDIYKFASGTYYVKEISAPAGYILSDKITTVAFKTTASDAGFSVQKTNNAANVTVDNATGYVTVSAVNTPNKLPSTGGMGTMMFTIGGAALIACAGILLFVLKRKAK